MKKSFLLTIVVMMMLVIVSAVCADDLSDVKQAGVIRFGAPLEYIPFVYQDETDNSNGMDIALMQEVARRMGLRLQTLSFARDGIIDALTIGQIDVIGGGLSKTDSRAQRIDFSRTYYNGEAQVISLASSPKPATVTLDSFRGLKLGVVKGSSFQEWVQKNLVDPGYMTLSSVYTYADSKDFMKALDRKDIDVVMIDQDVYEDRYRASGNYQVFYTGFNTENYAFGMRKGSTLTQEINNHLNDMIKDGTAQNIANRFFSMNFNEKEDQAISRTPVVATLAPVVTAAPATCVNAMSYVADVTVKDGQNFNPNSGFRKTWRIYNNGSCTWDSNYYLDYVSGDRMNGGSARIPGTVKPGQTVDISVDLKAPSNGGNYKGYWQMRAPNGTAFGQTIWVSIKVSGSAPAPTATPQDGQTRVVPRIDYFTTSSDFGNPGDSLMVYWSTTNAGGVTITVDGYQITNEGPSGSYQLQAPIQGEGTHTITLTAHSVTDDVSESMWFIMNGSGSGSGNDGQTQVIPVIDYFSADSYSGNPGDGTTVYWSTSNAGGVTITVDGYQISNEGASGSYSLQAPLQGAGTHSITLIAHSVTDDASQTIYYTMNEPQPDNSWESGNDWGSSDDWGMTEQDWQDFSNAVDNMTEQDWQDFSDALDSMTEQDWQDFSDALDSMTDEDWAALESLLSEEENY